MKWPQGMNFGVHPGERFPTMAPETAGCGAGKAALVAVFIVFSTVLQSFQHCGGVDGLIVSNLLLLVATRPIERRDLQRRKQHVKVVKV